MKPEIKINQESTSHDLISFFNQIIVKRKANSQSCFNYDVALKHLVRFSKDQEIPFKSINKEWIDSLHKFLLNTSSFKNETTLRENSASTYFSIVIRVLKEAAQCRHIDAGILRNIKQIKRSKLKTEPLSERELSQLAEAKCDSVNLKRAFLLSSLTGIQWKEIVRLEWHQIERVGETSYQINFKGERIVPLNYQAHELVSSVVSSDDKVFANLKWNAYLYIKLNKWALRAGILRNITFQSARITFAQLLHEKGIPVEIISELLGHNHLKSTREWTQPYSPAASS